MSKMPWNAFELEGWSIVGMNHYYVNEMRCLFVAMAKNGQCIKAEGPNEEVVLMQLRIQAEAVETHGRRTPRSLWAKQGET